MLVYFSGKFASDWIFGVYLLQQKRNKMKARTKLENAGYKVVTTMQGNYIAKKGNRTYMADSISGLVKQIFG